MKNKTPAERSAIARKAQATRRQNRRRQIDARIDQARGMQENWAKRAARAAYVAAKWGKVLRKLEAERERYMREAAPLFIVPAESDAPRQTHRKYSAD